MSGAHCGHWFPAYIGLGSNLQEPERQIENAFECLSGLRNTRLIKRSSLYGSAPFGGVEQPDFINAAAALLTQLSAAELWAQMQQIEKKCGRRRESVRWGPRVLDLDLLVYANLISDQAGLTVPHPGIGERNFVILPLAEVAPGLNIPNLGQVGVLAADVCKTGISRMTREVFGER